MLSARSGTSSLKSPPATGKPRRIASRSEMLRKFKDELAYEKPKTPPRPLPDIPQTSLHTEMLFRSLDTKDVSGITELVKLSGKDVLAGHDWLHHRGRTPMHRVVETEDVALVRLLAVTLQGDVNVQDANGRTPVHLACRIGNADVLRTLLEAPDIDLGLGSNHRGHTPLHLTAVYGHPDLALLLLDAGANVNAQNLFGETSLHMAAQYDTLGVAEVLLRAGADLHVRTSEFKHLALHYATATGSSSVAILLQTVGSSVHEPEREGVRTALDLACSFGHHRLGGLLLREERRKREDAESRRRAQEAAAEVARQEAIKHEARMRVLRARERVYARRAEERAKWKAEEAERKRRDEEVAAEARKQAMARVKRLARERAAKGAPLV